MSESTENLKKPWWQGCGCCDGNDKNCKCFHHGFSGRCLLMMFIKFVVVFIVLIFTFAAGVIVGKHAGYGRGFDAWKDGRGYPRMMYRRMQDNTYYRYPMMHGGRYDRRFFNEYYPQPNIQPPAVSPFAAPTPSPLLK